jgi:regulatory protein
VRALGLLARREHARGELEFKLASGGVEADAIRRVLDALEARGLLSEERFAEQFVRSRRNRGQGPRRIREELRRRGIGDAAATEALGQDDEYWSEQASQARFKRFGEAAPADYREWARQARFLERRGFTTEQIRSALGPPPRR